MRVYAKETLLQYIMTKYDKPIYIMNNIYMYNTSSILCA